MKKARLLPWWPEAARIGAAQWNLFLARRKEPRRDYRAGCFAENQGVCETDGLGRADTGLCRPHAGGVLDALRADVGLASRGKPLYRVASSGGGHPVLGPRRSGGHQCASALGQRDAQLRVPTPRPMALLAGSDVGWASGKENRKHLQLRQSPTATAQGPALQQIQACASLVPLFRDGAAHHAQRLSYSLSSLFLHEAV